MIKKIFFLTLAAFNILAFTACEEEVNESYSDELLRLQAYMRVNYPNFKQTPSGLYWNIIEEGTGDIPTKGKYILFNYTGYNLDLEAFETNLSDNAKLHDLYNLGTHYVPKFTQYRGETNRLLPGLDEALSLMKAGSKIRVIMPSDLAYGSTTHSILKPYSSLIYDIYLERIISDPNIYEIEIITDYLTANYPDLVPSEVITYMKGEGKGVYIMEESEDEVANVDEDVNPYITIVDDDVINVNYAGRFADSWLFDTNIKKVDEDNKTYNPNKTYVPLKVTVGSQGQIDGFSIALRRLRTNTSAKVLIMSSAAYGENGSGSNIHPYTPLIFELTGLTKTKAN